MPEFAIYSPLGHRQFASASQRLTLNSASLPDEWVAWGLGKLRIEIAFHDDQTVTISNHGKPITATWTDDTIPQDGQVRLRLPLQLCRDSWILEIQPEQKSLPVIGSFHGLFGHSEPDNTLPHSQSRLGFSPAVETLAGWFDALGRLHRSAAGSKELFQETLKAVIDPGGLDGSVLVTCQNGTWQIVDSCLPQPEHGISFCRELVHRVAQEGQVLYQDVQPATNQTGSETDALVAAPIFSPDQRVIGVICASRFIRGENLRRCIRPLESYWVQLLADAISSGLQRLEAEAEAARTRVVFEQAFSSEIAGQLIDNPAILDGKEKEVTVLFADLRKSSSIAERLTPEETYELLSQVLEQLTNGVLNHGGTLIDYYGDGLAAMWNAPSSQSDHAFRACQAGWEMLHCLDKTSDRWEPRIGDRLKLGIGINTGQSQVGNAGTKRRLKYGPRGTAVNIASRLESATKLLGTPFVISGSTAEQLPPAVVAPRICRAYLDGITNPVAVHHVVSLNERRLRSRTANCIHEYERMLDLYESGNLDQALALISTLESVTTDETVMPIKVLARQISKSESGSLKPIFDLRNQIPQL